MIRAEQLYDHLGREGISFYTGVPDSLLKNFLQYVQDHTAGEQHIITANEGLALALASGYYLQSGKLPTIGVFAKFWIGKSGESTQFPR